MLETVAAVAAAEELVGEAHVATHAANSLHDLHNLNYFVSTLVEREMELSSF